MNDEAIDMLVTEVTLQNERIAELEHILETLKSQMIDGKKYDLWVEIINNALKK